MNMCYCNKQEIGGYFELQIEKMQEFHAEAIKLNSGRNALQYILKLVKPKKIFIPYFICDAIINAVRKANIIYEYYYIDEKMEIKTPIKPGEKEYLLYVNYFGLKDAYIKSLVEQENNIIIDNAQAFYAKPIRGVNAFYSPRKYFGVTDGGYAYIHADKKIEGNIPKSFSFSRMTHLLERIDKCAEAGYKEYLKSEKTISRLPIQSISKLTQSILQSINYRKCKIIRENNFRYLHEHLSKYNQICLDLSNINGPMVYPLLTDKIGLSGYLIKKNIYVAKYWQEVMKRIGRDEYEALFTEYLTPLPIDQRYGPGEMNIIINNIKAYLN